MSPDAKQQTCYTPHAPNGTVIYLHGFLSDGNSQKGRLLRQAAPEFGCRVLAPDLNSTPEQALSAALDCWREASSLGPVHWVGSSLGGFFAAAMAQKTGCRAVLINPAVEPWTIVSRYVGVHPVNGGRRMLEVRPAFAASLKKMAVRRFDDPSRVMLLLTTGDEVLDWRDAAALWKECPQTVIEGGDHQVSAFDRYVRGVLAFLTRAH